MPNIDHYSLSSLVSSSSLLIQCPATLCWSLFPSSSPGAPPLAAERVSSGKCSGPVQMISARYHAQQKQLNTNIHFRFQYSTVITFSRAKNLWHIICSPVWMDAWSVLNNACSGAALWVPELCVSERGAGVYPYPLLLSHWQRDGRPRLHVRSCLQGRGEQVSVIVRHLKHK